MKVTKSELIRLVKESLEEIGAPTSDPQFEKVPVVRWLLQEIVQRFKNMDYECTYELRDSISTLEEILNSEEGDFEELEEGGFGQWTQTPAEPNSLVDALRAAIPLVEDPEAKKLLEAIAYVFDEEEITSIETLKRELAPCEEYGYMEEGVNEISLFGKKSSGVKGMQDSARGRMEELVAQSEDIKARLAQQGNTRWDEKLADYGTAYYSNPDTRNLVPYAMTLSDALDDLESSADLEEQIKSALMKELELEEGGKGSLSNKGIPWGEKTSDKWDAPSTRKGKADAKKTTAKKRRQSAKKDINSQQ